MFYCDDCDRSFSSWNAREQHFKNSPAHGCSSCGLYFDDVSDLQDHFEEDHTCRICDRFFKTTQGLDSHANAKHPGSYCQSCGRSFSNEFALRQHYRDSPAHHYCYPCDKHFQSKSNLRTHLASSIHVEKSVKCRGRGCNLMFVSVSAMLLHLESGSCVSGATRPHINARVRELDTGNVITRPDRLITGPSPDIKYYATSKSWNGSAYECYLCHREFLTLQALNSHLASPRHEENMYICPWNTCRTTFSTLSGFCAHVESETCGVKRFKFVQNTMDSLLRGMGRLTM